MEDTCYSTKSIFAFHMRCLSEDVIMYANHTLRRTPSQNKPFSPMFSLCRHENSHWQNSLKIKSFLYICTQQSSIKKPEIRLQPEDSHAWSMGDKSDNGLTSSLPK